MAGINDSDSIVAAASGIYVGSAYIIGFFFDLRGFLRLCRCFVIDGMSVFVLVGEGDAVIAMVSVGDACNGECRCGQKSDFYQCFYK